MCRWFQNFDWDGLANQTMHPPLLQPVDGPLDTSNFDEFPMDSDDPVDELSGWDDVGVYGLRLTLYYCLYLFICRGFDLLGDYQSFVYSVTTKSVCHEQCNSMRALM